MDQFPVGTEVDVRSRADLGWHPGVVVESDSRCWRVQLDAPNPTADEWSGVSRRYGASEPVLFAIIMCQVDFLVPDELIKLRGA